jgi:hypothetical protein
MPPDKRSGPRPVAGSRPNINNFATATIPRPAVTGRRKRAARRRDAVTCRVSLLAPGGRRTKWWYLATCPACGAPHLGRARELADVTGTRRLPCRHWVVVVVARTYGREAAA